MKKFLFILPLFIFFLLPQNVNAEWVSMYQSSMNCGNTGNISTCNVYNGAFQDTFQITASSNPQLYYRRFYYTTPITFESGTYDYLLFTYYFRFDEISETTSYNMNQISGSDWESTDSMTWYNGYGFYGSLDPAGSNCIVLDTSTVSPYKYYNLLCPIGNTVSQINSIYIRGLIAVESTGTHYFNHGVSGMMMFHKSEGSTLNEILTQEQATTQAVNELNTSMNDSTTSDANSTASGFFSNFSVSSMSGLTTLATAPLTLVNAMSDTCEPISLSFNWDNSANLWSDGLPDKTISLPCGTTIFWEKISYGNKISNFRNFWNVVFGGAIIYALGVAVMKQINKALDPMEDGLIFLGDSYTVNKKEDDKSD